MDTIKTPIRQFLNDQISDYAPTDDEDIFESGYVSSLFAIQIILFLEREFGVSITGKDLNPDNISSINRMAALVERQAAATA